MKPDAVEDITIWIHPDVQVGGQDVVEGSDLLVPEERVRHPDLAHVGQSQVFDFIWEEKKTVRPVLCVEGWSILLLTFQMTL